jgi:hypothetical protein
VEMAWPTACHRLLFMAQPRPFGAGNWVAQHLSPSHPCSGLAPDRGEKTNTGEELHLWCLYSHLLWCSLVVHVWFHLWFICGFTCGSICLLIINSQLTELHIYITQEREQERKRESARTV